MNTYSIYIDAAKNLKEAKKGGINMKILTNIDDLNKAYFKLDKPYYEPIAISGEYCDYILEKNGEYYIHTQSIYGGCEYEQRLEWLEDYPLELRENIRDYIEEHESDFEPLAEKHKRIATYDFGTIMDAYPLKDFKSYARAYKAETGYNL